MAGTDEEVCNLLFSRSVDALKLTDVLKLRSSDTADFLFEGIGRLLMREDKRMRMTLVSTLVAVAVDITSYGICDEVWE